MPKVKNEQEIIFHEFIEYLAQLNISQKVPTVFPEDQYKSLKKAKILLKTESFINPNYYKTDFGKLAQELARHIWPENTSLEHEGILTEYGYVYEQLPNGVIVALYIFPQLTGIARKTTRPIMNKPTVPIILLPIAQLEKLFKEERRILKELRQRIFSNRMILLAFPLIIPLLPIEKIQESRRDVEKIKEYFKILKNTIARIRKIASQINKKCIEGTESDYLYYCSQNYLIELLISFTAPTGLLKHSYSLFKETKGWKMIWKWFEETIKSILTKYYVDDNFPKEVSDYIIEKYDTGGPDREDFAIPIRKNNHADIVLVDTKHRKKDICQEIRENTEKILQNNSIQHKQLDKNLKKETLFKYIKYLKRKSKHLIKLEKMVKKETKIKNYHLLFIQLEKANPTCIKAINNLNNTIKTIHDNKTPTFTKIKFIDITELLDHIKSKQLDKII